MIITNLNRHTIENKKYGVIGIDMMLNLLRAKFAKNVNMITEGNRQYFEPCKCKHKNTYLINNPNGINKSNVSCKDCKHTCIMSFKGKSIWVDNLLTERLSD